MWMILMWWLSACPTVYVDDGGARPEPPVINIEVAVDDGGAKPAPINWKRRA